MLFIFTIIQLSLFLLITRIKVIPKKLFRFLTVLVVVFFMVIPAFFFQDIETDIAEFTRLSLTYIPKIDIYTNSIPSAHYYLSNYFPFWVFVVKLLYSLSQLIPLSYITLLKIPNILANLGIALLLSKIAKLEKLKIAKEKIILLFLLNPIPSLISVYQGHFDSVILFFLLFSLWLYLGKKYFYSGLLFSLSILVKPWPLLFIVFFIFRLNNWQNRLKYILGLIIPLGIITQSYIVYFQSSWINILTSINKWNGVYGWWGISLVWLIIKKRIFPLADLSYLVLPIKWILIGMIYLISLTSKIKPLNFLALLILLFYVFAPGFSIHYLFWIIPFSALIIQDFRRYIVYTSITSVFLLITFIYIVFPHNTPLILSEYSVGLIVNLLSLLIWGYCVYWLFNLFVRFHYE